MSIWMCVREGHHSTSHFILGSSLHSLDHHQIFGAEFVCDVGYLEYKAEVEDDEVSAACAIREQCNLITRGGGACSVPRGDETSSMLHDK